MNKAVLTIKQVGRWHAQFLFVQLLHGVQGLADLKMQINPVHFLPLPGSSAVVIEVID